MEETLKKKFVLLSAVAKEKKYAQEYLGLLARRGDIGSIRIGKRWYTTWQWFEEFLENSMSKKKESEKTCEVIDVKAVKTKKEKLVSEAKPKNKQRINISVVVPERRKMPVSSLPSARGIREIGDIRMANKSSNTRQKKSFPTKVSIAERNRYAIPYQEIRLRKKANIFSPDLSGEGKSQTFVFPWLTLAISFAVVILIVISGYLVSSNVLPRKGLVAGASNESNNDFSSINYENADYLVSTGDKMKESFSISRVIVEVAKEKSKNPRN